LHLSRGLDGRCFVSCPSFSFPGGSIWGLVLWCWWLVYVECGLSNSKRCLISRCTDFWFVCCHSSSLLMLSGQRIQRTILRQLLMNVWIFFAVFTVVLQVSAPYSSTDFTLELNSGFWCWLTGTWMSISLLAAG
jgi:hypothetical protein